MSDETPEQRANRIEFEEHCAQLGREIAAKLPKDVGFAFLMFDFGGPGNFAYVSNAQREDFVTMLHEILVKLGGEH